MIRYRFIILDLDGTLVDSKDDLAEAVNVTLETLGEPRMEPEIVHGFVGHGVRVLMERSLGPDRRHLLEDAIPLFLEHYRSNLLNRTRPYPGIERALEDVRDLGCRMAVLTNKPMEMTERILTGLGLMPFFANVVGGDSLPTRKPDPAGILLLCQRACVRAAESLMVGDSDVDVATGKAGVVATCGVEWGFGSPSLRGSNPDYSIRAPSELVRVVAGLTGAWSGDIGGSMR